jgi:hypothetical protein
MKEGKQGADKREALHQSYPNPNPNHSAPKQPTDLPTDGAKQLVEKKSFQKVLEPAAKSVHEIEGELWKKNVVKGTRSRKDFLDVTQEDFAKNTTTSVEGEIITPSSKHFQITV